MLDLLQSLRPFLVLETGRVPNNGSCKAQSRAFFGNDLEPLPRGLVVIQQVIELCEDLISIPQVPSGNLT